MAVPFHAGSVWRTGLLHLLTGCIHCPSDAPESTSAAYRACRCVQIAAKIIHLFICSENLFAQVNSKHAIKY